MFWHGGQPQSSRDQQRTGLTLTFLRSRGGSALGMSRPFGESRDGDGPLSALMTSDEADGTTLTAACRFWIVSWTVTRRPLESAVAFAMSSPTFLGDRPSGPIFGASCGSTLSGGSSARAREA